MIMKEFSEKMRCKDCPIMIDTEQCEKRMRTCRKCEGTFCPGGCRLYAKDVLPRQEKEGICEDCELF